MKTPETPRKIRGHLKSKVGTEGPSSVITKNRKRTARNIRSGVPPLKNSDNTTSTHKMEWGQGPGRHKYHVNPTVFPQKDGAMRDLSESENKMASYNEAKARGEIFGFKKQGRAERFSAGSWKKGSDRKEAMRSYRNNKNK